MDYKKKKDLWKFATQRSKELIVTRPSFLVIPQSSTKNLLNPAIKKNRGRCGCTIEHA